MPKKLAQHGQHFQETIILILRLLTVRPCYASFLDLDEIRQFRIRFKLFNSKDSFNS